MSKKDILKELGETKCQYPVMGEEGKMEICGKDQMMMCSLPIVKELEGGKIEYSESEAMTVSLCHYHSFLAMELGFGVRVDASMGKCQLFAPFEQIRMIETVLSLMILSGTVQELLKQKEESDASVKKMRETVKKKA